MIESAPCGMVLVEKWGSDVIHRAELWVKLVLPDRTRADPPDLFEWLRNTPAPRGSTMNRKVLLSPVFSYVPRLRSDCRALPEFDGGRWRACWVERPASGMLEERQIQRPDWRLKPPFSTNYLPPPPFLRFHPPKPRTVAAPVRPSPPPPPPPARPPAAASTSNPPCKGL